MAHESHDYKATAAKLRELARQVHYDYWRDQLYTNGAGVSKGSRNMQSGGSRHRAKRFLPV